jgi:mRNA interferase RelE/StbE
MEVAYILSYHEKVVRDDIPRLNGGWKKRIKTTIEHKLQHDPLLYGVPLRRDLHGCYKLRIGDYRVIYFVKNKTVYIVAIRHRRDVYESGIQNRL